MKYIIIVISTIIFLTSCQKESIENSGKYPATLSGSWHLVKYVDIKRNLVLTEPSNLTHPVILVFDDNMRTGKMAGHTMINIVKGTYEIYDSTKIRVTSFGGTKIGEPKWGGDFWKAIRKGSSFSVSAQKLVIYYDYDTKYMEFKPDNQYYKEVYTDQTQCSDPWGTTGNTLNDITKDSIMSYFSKQNILVYRVNFTRESELDSLCEACICGTGQRIFITVNTLNIDKMIEMGFKEKVLVPMK